MWSVARTPGFKKLQVYSAKIEGGLVAASAIACVKGTKQEVASVTCLSHEEPELDRLKALPTQVLVGFVCIFYEFAAWRTHVCHSPFQEHGITRP